MAQATLGRWGKSLAVRLPSDVVSAFNFRDGDRVDVEIDGDSITIRRSRAPYTLEDLFAGRSPEEWRALYADSYDWGPDVGREIIEE